MAAPVAESPGLVRAFADFALLPDLLKLGTGADTLERWTALLRDAGFNASHVLDHDIGSSDLAAYMADDAWRLASRLGLIDPEAPSGLTPSGNIIQRLSPVRPGTAASVGAGMFALRPLFGREVETYYEKAHGVRIARNLRQAVRVVGEIDSPWSRYVPGLLLAEFDFVLSELTRGERDWSQIADALEGTRDEVERLLGEPVPRMRRRDSANFADAVTAFYWQGLAHAPTDRMTVTAARANVMLFAFADILEQGGPVGPVQHLVLPRRAPPQLTERPEPMAPVPRGAILIGADEAIVWQPPISNEEAIVRLYGLGDSDFRRNQVTYERLGIDRRTRAEEDNPFPFSDTDRELHDGRWMDKALSMELLSSIALSALDTPDYVRNFCLARHGRPNYFAPSGKLDVLASYPASGSRGAFAVAAEVSSKREMSIEDYKAQLNQGVKHAQELLAEGGHGFSTVYVLVANVRDAFSDQAAWDAYHEVVDETGIATDPRIKLLPMHSKDLAFAAERVNDAYWDAPSGFGPDALAAALDEQVALLAGDDPFDSPTSVRDIWNQVEDPGRFGDLLAQATLGPKPPESGRSGPSPN